MRTHVEQLKKKVTDALKQVADHFGLELVAPITFAECPGTAALAFIRHFGSPEGVLLDSIAPPTYEGDKVLQSIAQAKQMYYSQVNIERLANYDEGDFIDLFRDWGYYGDSPPSWLREGREESKSPN